jgi:hypothetical protein
VRNVVLLLLLANFGVWAVFSWVIQEPPVRPTYDGPGITLLRELPRDGTPSSETGIPAEPRQPANQIPLDSGSPEGNAEFPGATDDEPLIGLDEQIAALSRPGPCISIGPFREPAEADVAMATLADAGFEPRRTIREAEVWEGYWVFIGQLGSAEAAREIEADLADNGIDDSYILPSSDSGILISLGVFSETTRAMNIAERAREIGYEPTIADSMTTQETYWLDIMLTDQQSVALELLQAPGRISRLEQMACADDAAI